MGKEQRSPFYPDYLAVVTLVIFLTLELALILTLAFPQDIGRLIDFTSPYQPKPEWYFLWIYQLVRYFPGKWAFLGTVGVPVAAILILIYLPWIDRGRYGRLKACLIALTLLASFIILTILPLLD